MKKVKKNVKGVTMVALVVTIIVLLILSAITIGLTVGKNGLFSRSKKAADEHIKQEAMEAMNLKITGIQIESYTENQKLPNLQYLADKLCEDIEMEYVEKETKKQASLNKIDVTGLKSIFTKIKKYPYEFEIDSELKLASIDGVKIAKGETIPEGYLKPSGTKEIEENGEYDITEYEKVKVNVPMNIPSNAKVIYNMDVSGTWGKKNYVVKDSDVEKYSMLLVFISHANDMGTTGNAEIETTATATKLLNNEYCTNEYGQLWLSMDIITNFKSGDIVTMSSYLPVDEEYGFLTARLVILGIEK